MQAAEPKQERSRATRERLLEATVASLADVGWARTTVATVAARAGVSRGAAQHHFPTREDMVTAAIRYMSEVRLADLLGTLAAPPSDASRTRWALDQIVGVYTGTLFSAALHVWTEAAVDPALRAQVIPLERAIARESHRLALALLGVSAEDDTDPRVRAIVAATLDLARGLGLADVLTDDASRRARILDVWAEQLDEILVPTRR